MTESTHEEIERERVQSEIVRNQLEAEKLRVELSELEKGSAPWWHIRLATLLQALVGGAVAGALIWAFLIDHLLKIDEVAQRSVIASNKLAVELSEKTNRLERERTALQARGQELNSQVIQAQAEAKRLREALNEARRNVQATSEPGLGDLEASLSNIAREAEQSSRSLGAIHVANLLQQMNGETREQRRSTTQELIATYKADERAVDLGLEQLEEPQVSDLSASGRINVLVFLAATDASAWNTGRIGRARSALQAIDERARQGIAAVGPQTKSFMEALEVHLDSIER